VLSEYSVSSSIVENVNADEAALTKMTKLMLVEKALHYERAAQ
jgi:hypothetical protein